MFQTIQFFFRLFTLDSFFLEFLEPYQVFVYRLELHNHLLVLVQYAIRSYFHTHNLYHQNSFLLFEDDELDVVSDFNDILDFYCAKANIAVELDGSQHYQDEGMVNDKKRTEYLNQYGVKVVRISNLDVLKNFEGVCLYIDEAVRQSLSQLR